MNEKIIKTFSFDIKDIDTEKRTFWATASTEQEDRDGDTIKADAWKLKEFKKNPVIPLFHDYRRFPVAKAEKIHVEDGKLMFRPIFATKEQNPEAEIAWQLYSGGFMGAWSVGFIPKKWDEKERKSGMHGRDYTEVELLEISAVVVPSNPNALTEARAKGIDVDLISKEEIKTSKFSEKDLENAEVWDMVLKPMPSEHSCRLESPDKYIRIRRQNDKFGDGIHAIWGVQAGDEPVELQAIRFDKSKHSVSEAKSWLSEHDYKCKLFEPATERCLTCGKEMSWAQKVTGEDDYQPTCDCNWNFKKYIEDFKKELAVEFANIYMLQKTVEGELSLIKKGMGDLSDRAIYIEGFIKGMKSWMETRFKEPESGVDPELQKLAKEILNRVRN